MQANLYFRRQVGETKLGNDPVRWWCRQGQGFQLYQHYTLLPHYFGSLVAADLCEESAGKCLEYVVLLVFEVVPQCVSVSYY